MTTWTPDRLEASQPVYIAIADALARDLEAGRLKPGDRLPTHRALARRLGVNVMTITRSYAEASRRGLVEGEVGRGTFIRDSANWNAGLHPLESQAPNLIDFHFNLPVGQFELLDLPATFRGLAAQPELASLDNGYHAKGLMAHREIGTDWIRSFGLEADPERVMVCGGAQHGMTLALGSLAGPNDLVLTEELTYTGMKSLATLLRLRLHGLPIDEHGLHPEAFEEACRKSQPKALYCMPTLQNPTGALMPSERREEIARIARQYGVAIVEDDTYGFQCQDPIKPLSHYAPELSYYVTSTSKSLSSGLRVGFVLAPVAVREPNLALERMASLVPAIAWMIPPLMAEIACQWIRDGRAERMMEWKRKDTAARRALFEEHLPQISLSSHRDSGHVWVSLPSPWRSESFVHQARRRGVAMTSAESFVVGRAHCPHAVRLCLATPPTHDMVARGLRILREMFDECPSACCEAVV